MNNDFNNWTEVKTAWLVAKLGTLSAAAEALGVHRATVLRHVDALEDAVGVKLFQRHARGYEPTEAGLALIKVACVLDEQLDLWRGTIRRQTLEFTGEIIITGLEVISPFLAPMINAFKEQHPKVVIRYLASTERFRLEYGTAHIAFRTGAKPQEPDNIVQPFCRLPIGLYAHENYIAQHGMPCLPDDAAKHTFVGPENTDLGVPFFQWLNENIPRDRVTIRSTSQMVMGEAVKQGLGIGFVLRYEAQNQPQLVEINEPLVNWQIPIWMLTHVDLHRSAKVQAFMNIVKDKQYHNDVFTRINALRY